MSAKFFPMQPNGPAEKGVKASLCLMVLEAEASNQRSGRKVLGDV